MGNNFIIRALVITGFIVFFMVPGFSAKAKMAIQLEQKIVFVSKIDVRDNFITAEGEMFEFKDEEVKRKVFQYVGKQARILYFRIAEKLVCVDIASLASQPFDLGQASELTTSARSLKSQLTYR